jgi:hypothetical protein
MHLIEDDPSIDGQEIITSFGSMQMLLQAMDFILKFSLMRNKE